MIRGTFKMFEGPESDDRWMLDDLKMGNDFVRLQHQVQVRNGFSKFKQATLGITCTDSMYRNIS